MKIAVAITGASGSIYAKTLLDRLLESNDALDEVGIVISDNAKEVWEYELGNRNFEKYPFHFFDKKDFFAPFASGSSSYQALVICPCSMGTLGRIAAGMSDDLITRAADVMLKERRKLILIVRETPYNLVHLRNMTILTEAGAIICPASPSFYSKPQNFESLASTVTDRALTLAGLKIKSFKWQEHEID